MCEITKVLLRIGILQFKSVDDVKISYILYRALCIKSEDPVGVQDRLLKTHGIDRSTDISNDRALAVKLGSILLQIVRQEKLHIYHLTLPPSGKLK